MKFLLALALLGGDAAATQENFLHGLLQNLGFEFSAEESETEFLRPGPGIAILPELEAKEGSGFRSLNMPFDIHRYGIYAFAVNATGGPQFWTIGSAPSVALKAEGEEIVSQLLLSPGRTGIIASLPNGADIKGIALRPICGRQVLPSTSWTASEIAESAEKKMFIDLAGVDNLLPDKSVVYAAFSQTEATFSLSENARIVLTLQVATSAGAGRGLDGKLALDNCLLMDIALPAAPGGEHEIAAFDLPAGRHTLRYRGLGEPSQAGIYSKDVSAAAYVTLAQSLELPSPIPAALIRNEKWRSSHRHEPAQVLHRLANPRALSPGEKAR